jgi:steroid 5-alpha reductase family enzyme
MLIALYITLAYFTLFFIVATIIKNNSIVDIGWGFGFVMTSWILFFINGSYGLNQIIINAMISLWGLRLFYYILKRNIFDKEDFRYANWRKAWGKWVIPRAFLQVFMLQGILQFSIGSTSFYLNTNGTDFALISLIGVALWVIGYYFEVFGDRQLKTHIKDKTQKGKLLTTGLWSKTRHPNYFGEALMWWGVYVFAILNGVPIYFIFSPLTITIVLYFISTPILEEKMKGYTEWDDYSKKTSMFLPFKLKLKGEETK